MKTLNPNQTKWFLTVALLSALVLNSGLWQMKQNGMSSSDFSSTDGANPTKMLEELKAKKQTAETTLEKAKLELEKAKAALIVVQNSTNTPTKAAEETRAKADVDTKEASVRAAQTAVETANSDIVAFQAEIKKLQEASTAATVTLPGIPACNSAECREAALNQKLAELQGKFDKMIAEKAAPATKEKTAEEKNKERTEEELDRVTRICKDEREDKLLKCYASELSEMLDRNKGDKKLDKKLVIKYYQDKVEEPLRAKITSTQSADVNAALAIVGRFEKSLPSEYNYLRDEVTDTARQSAKQLAVNSQDYLKAAERVRTEDPGLATYYLRMHNYSRDLFENTATRLDRSLLSNLGSARRESLITDSYMNTLYKNRWGNEIYPIARGLRINPRTLRIVDEEDYSFEHMMQEGISRGFSLASNVASGNRRQGRNANTRLGDHQERTALGSSKDERNLDTIFGTLGGADTGRKGSGRRARSN